MIEVWKIIKDYSDYQISNYGKIKSFKYNKERILKHGIDKSGYLFVCLYNKDILKKFYIHRLVLQAFIQNSKNKLQVNHIDGNKENNRVNNLEWCTNSENRKHAFKIGLLSLKGERNNNSKLSENNVLTIHGLYLSGMKQKEIAKIYGIHRRYISYIVTGKAWEHLIGS